MAMQLNVTVNPVFNSSTFASAGAAAGASFSSGLNSSVSKAQPLGRITGQVTEFDKSMAAANARVIAFGASAGSIFVIKSAFEKLITSTIQVEKTLADINVILGMGSSSFKNFSNEIFKAANMAGQTFQTAGEVALEFARHGVTAEETVKRMSAALQLMRISGLNAQESVNAITASLNAFSKEMMTAEDVVNKIAAVDTKFAVSAQDLANAIQRVGSTANDAGLEFNQLLGIVTAAQTITARGGAVIGNAFKSIFTRLARPQVLEDLRSLGIETKNLNGDILPTITILRNLANQYDKLSSSQRSFVAEAVGGVYQINILKATLADLGNGMSVFDRATETAAGSSDTINERMETLNQTISSKLIVSGNNLTKLFSNIGQSLFSKPAKTGLDSFNENIESISSLFEDIKPDDSFGLKIGKTLSEGFMKGLGGVLSGPGLQILMTLLTKVIADFGGYAIKATKDFMGLYDTRKKQEALEQSINNFLSQNSNILNAIKAGQLDINKVHLIYLQQLNQEAQLKAQNAAISTKIATAASPYISATKPKTTIAKGFIPNFNLSSGDVHAEMSEAKANGYTINPSDVYERKIHLGDGKGGKGPAINAIVNRKEDVHDTPVGTFVLNPHQKGMFAAKGFVPNFKTLGAQKTTVGQIINKYKRSKSELNEKVQENDIINISPIKIEEIPFDKDGEVAKAYQKIRLNRLEIDKAAKVIEELTQKSIGGKLTSAKDSGIKYGSNSALDIVGKDFAAEVKSGSFDDDQVREKFLRFPIENAGQRRGISPYSGEFTNKQDTIKSPSDLRLYTKPSKDKIDEEIKKLNKASGFVPNFASKVGIITGDALRGNQYKKALEYLANTNKSVTSIVGPAGSGKTSRAVNEYGGEIVKATNFDDYESFIFDRAGFDLPQKDTVSADNIQKILKKSGSIDVLISSRDTLKKAREKRAGEGDKNIPERTYFKTGSGGAGTFAKEVRGFLSENKNARAFQLKQKEGGEFYHKQLNLASGFVPNFAEQTGPANPEKRITDAAVIAGSFQQVWDKRISEELDKETERKLKAKIPKGTPTTEEANLRTRYEETAGTALTNYLETSPELEYTKILRRFHTNTLPGGGSFPGFDYILDTFTNNNFLKNKLNWKDNYSMDVNGKQLTGAKGKMLLSMKTSKSNEKAADIRRKMELGKEKLRNAEVLGAEEQTSEMLIGLHNSPLSNQIQAFKKSKKLGAEDYNKIGPKTAFGTRGSIVAAAASGFIPNFASENAINALKEIASGKRGGTRFEIINARDKLKELGYDVSKQIKTGILGASFGKSGIEITLTDIDEQFDIDDAVKRIHGNNAFAHVKNTSLNKLKEILKKNPSLSKNINALQQAMGDDFRIAGTPYASGYVPNFALAPGGKFANRGQLKGVYGDEGRQYSVTGFVNKMDPTRFTINWLEGAGKGAAFEKFIPQFKEDLNKIGVNAIDYTAEDTDGRQKVRHKLFQRLIKKYAASGYVPNFFDYLNNARNILKENGLDLDNINNQNFSQFKEVIQSKVGSSNISGYERALQNYLYGGSSGWSLKKPSSKGRGGYHEFAAGFIPNFNSKGLSEAMNREMAAGYSRSEVKVGYDSRLEESGGLGVYNKTEGSLGNAINMHLAQGKTLSDIQTQGINAAKGFVPNFEMGSMEITMLLGVLKPALDGLGKRIEHLNIGYDATISKNKSLYDAFDKAQKKVREAKINKDPAAEAEAKRERDIARSKLRAANLTRKPAREAFNKKYANYQKEMEEKSQKFQGKGAIISMGAPILGGMASTSFKNLGFENLAKSSETLTDSATLAGQAMMALPPKLGKIAAIGIVSTGTVNAILDFGYKVETANKQFERQKQIQDQITTAMSNYLQSQNTLTELLKSGSASLSQLTTATKSASIAMSSLAEIDPELARKMALASTPQQKAQVQVEAIEKQALQTKQLGFMAELQAAKRENPIWSMFGGGMFTAGSKSEEAIQKQKRSTGANVIKEEILRDMESEEGTKKTAGEIRKRIASGTLTVKDAEILEANISRSGTYRKISEESGATGRQLSETMSYNLRSSAVAKDDNTRNTILTQMQELADLQRQEIQYREIYNQQLTNQFELNIKATELEYKGRESRNIIGYGREKTALFSKEQDLRLKSFYTPEVDIVKEKGKLEREKIEKETGFRKTEIQTKAGFEISDLITKSSTAITGTFQPKIGQEKSMVSEQASEVQAFIQSKLRSLSPEDLTKRLQSKAEEGKGLGGFGKSIFGEYKGSKLEGVISEKDFDILLQKIDTNNGLFDINTNLLGNILQVNEEGYQKISQQLTEEQAAIKEINFKEVMSSLRGLGITDKGARREEMRELRKSSRILKSPDASSEAQSRQARLRMGKTVESERDIKNTYISGLLEKIVSGTAKNRLLLAQEEQRQTGIEGLIAHFPEFKNLPQKGGKIDLGSEQALKIAREQATIQTVGEYKIRGVEGDKFLPKISKEEVEKDEGFKKFKKSAEESQQAFDKAISSSTTLASNIQTNLNLIKTSFDKLLEGIDAKINALDTSLKQAKESVAPTAAAPGGTSVSKNIAAAVSNYGMQALTVAALLKGSGVTPASIKGLATKGVGGIKTLAGKFTSKPVPTAAQEMVEEWAKKNMQPATLRMRLTPPASLALKPRPTPAQTGSGLAIKAQKELAEKAAKRIPINVTEMAQKAKQKAAPSTGRINITEAAQKAVNKAAQNSKNLVSVGDALKNAASKTLSKLSGKGGRLGLGIGILGLGLSGSSASAQEQPLQEASELETEPKAAPFSKMDKAVEKTSEYIGDAYTASTLARLTKPGEKALESTLGKGFMKGLGGLSIGIDTYKGYKEAESLGENKSMGMVFGALTGNTKTGSMYSEMGLIEKGGSLDVIGGILNAGLKGSINPLMAGGGLQGFALGASSEIGKAGVEGGRHVMDWYKAKKETEEGEEAYRKMQIEFKRRKDEKQQKLEASSKPEKQETTSVKKDQTFTQLSQNTASLTKTMESLLIRIKDLETELKSLSKAKEDQELKIEDGTQTVKLELDLSNTKQEIFAYIDTKVSAMTSETPKPVSI